jgi:hypothetical protein
MKIRLTTAIATADRVIAPNEVIDTQDEWALQLIANGHAVAIESAAIDPRERNAVRCIDASPRPDGRKRLRPPSSR